MRSRADPMRIAIHMAAALYCAAGMASASAESAPAGKSVVARGEQLSRLLCPACHVVAADQEFAPILRQRTPSFAEIANRPDTSATSLQRFISTTHWDEKTIPMQMPNPGLSKEEMKAVTAYILSLRKP
jgi:mono/diheme cytochrome c family protein